MRVDKKLLSVRSLALAAMLTAMSVVIGIFCKTVLNFADGLFRVTFENLPIILSGIIFGPGVGALVGAASDLISYLLSAQAYPPNLIVTLGAATVGAISGAVSHYLVKRRGTVQFIVSGALAHLVGSMIIKPIGLFQFYSWLVLWRIPLYLVIAPIEILIISLLYKNSAVRKLIDGAVRSFEKRLQPQVRSGNDNDNLQNSANSADKPTMDGQRSMTYDEAIEYIHSVSGAFCKPGLERISALCAALGNPERALKFVHVGGTNGKGSFCSMLDSTLRASGLKVGLYTSPYITEFGERMRVNGENIPRDTLQRLTERIRPIAEAMQDKPTEFELITALAFLYFMEEKVDVVVLEVGLGGRLDSTNIISDPLLSVVTGIALDHTAILGDTVEKIAYEKAGIIKQGCPVLYGGEDDVAAEVIANVAAERGSAYTRVDYSRLNVKEATLAGTRFDYGERCDLEISLLGSYQPRNAAVVLDAIDILRSRGVAISEAAIKEGLKSAVWHARFEIISESPLVIFDGAHNPQGIRGAVESIKAYFADERVYVISGVLADKDYRTVAKTLSEVASRAFTLTPDNPRALSAESYAEVLGEFGVKASAHGSIVECVRAAATAAATEGAPLVCLGSLYTYADVVKALNEYKKEI